MDMDRYSAPLRVVLNIATLKAYVTHNWAKSEFDLMQMPWRNLGSSEIGFCADTTRGQAEDKPHTCTAVTRDVSGAPNRKVRHELI